MKSSIEKKYQRTILPDGSLELTFTEGRVGAHHGADLARLIPLYCFVTLVLWIGSMFVIVAALDLVGIRPDMGTALVLALVVPIAAIVFVVKNRKKSGSRILVKKDGIIFTRPSKATFGGKPMQLAFEDIDSLGIKTETSSGGNAGYLEACYLYADAGGQEIRLTRYLERALANSLQKEILGHAQPG